MNKERIAINFNDGTYVEVYKKRLIADSRMFRYLIEELNQDELEFDDFPPNIVQIFMRQLILKKLGDVENDQFRDLYKLAVVYEVEWLKEKGKEWLKCKMDCAEADEEKKFLFDECLYILNKWEQQDMMQALLSRLATQNNASFLSQYMAHLDRLDTVQLDLLLRLGGSHCELFLRTILTDLEGKKELDQNIKHLIKHMNLAMCFEQNKELYLEVCETIQNLSDISTDDKKFVFQLCTETMISVSSRSEERKTRTTEVFGSNIFRQLVSCTTVKDMTDVISDNKVTSMFHVVDMLLFLFYKSAPSSEDAQIFITTLENICRERKHQKVSAQHLGMIITVLNYSPLPQRVQLIALLNEIKDNDKLSTYHENINIKCDKLIDVSPITVQRVLSTVKHFVKRDKSTPAGSVFKLLFTFKHPNTAECTEPGNCGFIIRESILEKNEWLRELSTDSEDYEGTGLHLHDIICGSDMYQYVLWAGNTAPDNKVQVPGWFRWWKYWLPDATYADWVYEQNFIVYNISDYVVTKQD